MKNTTRSRAAAVTIAALVLAGCAQTTGPREGAGTLAGAAIGGLVGSQFGGDTGSRLLAGAAGALIGGFIGNRVGAYLDAEEQRRLQEITRQTVRTGATRSFTGRNGLRVRTRVVDNSTNAVGDTCRRVEQQVILTSGAVAADTVTACRDRRTGQWSI
jgi:uncharacterized protein YcfJ